jgi:DNA-binding phage protein
MEQEDFSQLSTEELTDRESEIDKYLFENLDDKDFRMVMDLVNLNIELERRCNQ